jgi:hypothetical protein
MKTNCHFQTNKEIKSATHTYLHITKSKYGNVMVCMKTRSKPPKNFAQVRFDNKTSKSLI